jgi:osmotically inducible lipoprotein OsmB
MKFKRVLIGTVFATVLAAASGCDSMSHRDRATAVGAGAGAVGGAVLTGGSAAGTVGGAVVGGVIGHEVGDKDKNN